jgi:sigma-B regulation protein RsbU (phosphoserine phosphatase)
MNSQSELIDDLKTLNHIASTLNQAVDVQSILDDTLVRLVELMGLQTGWIFLRDETAVESWWGKGYTLAAHHNLPPALDLESHIAWRGGCDCQGFCNKGKLNEAYNEVRCTRLDEGVGDGHGLKVHASAPLGFGDEVRGIVNVAGSDWDAFSPRALELLNNVGIQLGAALQRARFFDLLRERRMHEQAALLDLSQQLLGRLELTDLMNYLVKQVKELLQADAATLLLPDADRSQYVFSAASGWRSDPVSSGRSIPVTLRSSPERPYPAGLTKLVTMAQDRGSLPAWLKEWQPSEGFESAGIVPLSVDERLLGALVVSCRTRRDFNDEELRFLQLMANQAAIAIEKARLHQDEMARQRFDEELAVGREIQLSLLPRSCPTPEGWQFCDIYQAARVVGGDFYDFFALPGDEQRLGLVIGDVADKGIPAALFMGVCRSLIRSAAASGLAPGQVLEQANRLILDESRSDLFLSAFYGILDLASGELTYASAGHNPPFWYQASSGWVEALAAQGIVLGVLDDISLEQKTVQVAAGDVVVFYTDGVTESMDGDWQEFGEERLIDSIRGSAQESATAILNAIVADVNDFSRDVDQSDDFTSFVVKRL